MRLSAEGRVVPTNIPWAHQLWNDIEAVGNLETMRSWYEDLDSDIRRVFAGPLSEQFLEWDAAELRASATSAAFAPPGYMRPPGAHVSASSSDNETPFECHERGVDAAACGRTFMTARALSVHLRSNH